MHEANFPLEKSIGMELYSTDFEGIGGILKHRPSDFIVEEITEDGSVQSVHPFTKEIRPPIAINGARKKARNIHLTVQKENLTTMDTVNLMCAALRLSRNMVSYAGLKDKRAITCQRMSVPVQVENELKELKIAGVQFRDFEYSRQPIKIGDLWGNRFTILLRNSDYEPETVVQYFKAMANTALINFFGVQRFGVVRPVTHKIGKALVQKDYEKAAKVILSTPGKYESDTLQEARKRMEDGEFSETVLKELPRDMRYERIVLKELINHPNDFKRAIFKLSPRLQTLFVHAFQSYLFNRLISKRCRLGMPINRPSVGDFLIGLDDAHTGRDDWIFVTDQNLSQCIALTTEKKYGVAIVIPGYASKMPNTRQTELVKKTLTEEEISFGDFRNPENRHLDSLGGLHLASIDIREPRVDILEEGPQFSFKLRKGSYATVVMREIMKNEPVNRI